MELFFELLQVAFKRRKLISKTPSDSDWMKVLQMAQKHGVEGFILESIDVLSDDIPKPSLPMLYQWIGLEQQIRTKYKQHENVTNELAALLSAGGFKMMILKGHGLSYNYPMPQLRPSGDLDIWCFGKEKEVDEYLEAKGIKIDRTHHHHTVFQYKNIPVENHFDFINIFTRLSNRRVEQKLKELAYKGNIEKNSVYYPTADFNAIFILRHCAGHFAATQLNIRQVLDWGFFMEKHHKEINWMSYIPYIKQERMYRFYNLLSLFCMRKLNFDASIFHGLYDDVLYERFSNEILSPEFDDREDGTLLKSLVVKPCRWWHNRWKNKLCYPDSLFSLFVCGLWSKILKPSHFVH